MEYRLPPLGECSRNPSVSVNHLVVLWEAVFSLIEFFWRLSTFAHFTMGDLQAHLPTLYWVFISFWSKKAWPAWPTLLIHPVSTHVTFVSLMKISSKGSIFPMWRSETKKQLKHKKTLMTSKNCFEQRKRNVSVSVLYQMESALNVTEV